jgi:hypothetical protein
LGELLQVKFASAADLGHVLDVAVLFEHEEHVAMLARSLRPKMANSSHDIAIRVGKKVKEGQW